MPRVHEISDPVLAAIWNEEKWLARRLEMIDSAEGHVLEVAGVPYIVLHRAIDGFGDVPLLVGTYFAASDASQQVQRLMAAGLGGIAVLLIALVLAIILGRAIGRPVERFARSA